MVALARTGRRFVAVRTETTRHHLHPDMDARRAPRHTLDHTRSQRALVSTPWLPRWRWNRKDEDTGESVESVTQDTPRPEQGPPGCVRLSLLRPESL